MKRGNPQENETVKQEEEVGSPVETMKKVWGDLLSFKATKIVPVNLNGVTRHGSSRSVKSSKSSKSKGSAVVVGKTRKPKKEKIAKLFVSEKLNMIPAPETPRYDYVPPKIDNLGDVHHDILIHILSWLHFRSFKQISKIGRINRNFRLAVQTNYFWGNSLPLLKKTAKYVKSEENKLLYKDLETVKYDDFVNLYRKSYVQRKKFAVARSWFQNGLKKFRVGYCFVAPLLICLSVLLATMIFPFFIPNKDGSSLFQNKLWIWILCSPPVLLMGVCLIILWTSVFLDFMFTAKSKIRYIYSRSEYIAFQKPMVALIFLFGFSVLPLLIFGIFLKGYLGGRVPFSVCFVPVYVTSALYLILPLCFVRTFRKYHKFKFWKLICAWFLGLVIISFADIQLLLVTLYLDNAFLNLSSVVLIFLPYFIFVGVFFVVCFVGFYLYSIWDSEYGV